MGESRGVSVEPGCLSLFLVVVLSSSLATSIAGVAGAIKKNTDGVTRAIDKNTKAINKNTKATQRCSP